LNYRFVVFGALLLVIGAVGLISPGILSSSSTVYDHTLLVRVAPGNYSRLQMALGPQQTLQVALSSSPVGVDFFLMNSSAFSAWASGKNEPSNVYPQSELDARNYTFATTATGTHENYSLVFISRSSNMSTSVLLNLVIDQEANTIETMGVPLVIIVCGVALALFGATRGKKTVEMPAQAHETQGGGLLGLFGRPAVENRPSVGMCRHCGASLEKGAVFCAFCGTSQR
jgi:hypothetical protein